MKTKTSLSVIHVLLFTRIFSFNQLIVKRKHIFQQESSTGISNWKDVIAKFTKHEGNCCHKDAILNTTTTGDTSEFYSPHNWQKTVGVAKKFLKLLSNVRFLSRQGLAFRGNGDESDSNFKQLIQWKTHKVKSRMND